MAGRMRKHVADATSTPLLIFPEVLHVDLLCSTAVLTAGCGCHSFVPGDVGLRYAISSYGRQLVQTKQQVQA